MFLLYSSYKNRIDTYYNVIAKDEYGNIVSEVPYFLFALFPRSWQKRAHRIITRGGRHGERDPRGQTRVRADVLFPCLADLLHIEGAGLCPSRRTVGGRVNGSILFQRHTGQAELGTVCHRVCCLRRRGVALK